jgi:hypothetical protein
LEIIVRGEKGAEDRGDGLTAPIDIDTGVLFYSNVYRAV